MNTDRLGMKLGEFYVQRVDAHTILWLVAGFLALWVAIHAGAEPLRGQFLLSGLLAFSVVVLSCLTFIPLLAVQPLVWLTVYLEARWRIRHNRPYTAPPPIPYSPPPEMRKVMIVERKRGGWLLPLAIGLWIGGSWGDDD
jgi:hypothetical protein